MFTPAASAAGSLSRIAAHARPGLRRDVDQRDEEHQRGDDHDVAVVRRVALGDRRAAAPAGGRRGRARSCGPVKPPPPFGKLIARQHDVHRARRHQRDQREVQAGEPERRQPDQHADRARDHAR